MSPIRIGYISTKLIIKANLMFSTTVHAKFYGPYLTGGVPDYDMLLSGA